MTRRRARREEQRCGWDSLWDTRARACSVDVQAVQDAERLGYHSVWTAEAYGSDAVVPLAWIGALTYRIRLGTAILQMAARTPAMTAMTAMTLDALSGGRALLGLGVSGPQVVEGWHGQPFGKPLGRTREYVSIVRAILARQRPLEHAGEHYQIPYRGPGATGPREAAPEHRARARRPADLPRRDRARRTSRSPRRSPTAGYRSSSRPARAGLFQQSLAEGFARAGAPGKRERFDVAPMAPVVVGRDVDACRAQVKPRLALYVGGMGARGRNFYFDLACRYGYEAAAARIQELYLAGRRPEAEAAVPDALVDEVALCGPRGADPGAPPDVARRRGDHARSAGRPSPRRSASWPSWSSRLPVASGRGEESRAAPGLGLMPGPARPEAGRASAQKRRRASWKSRSRSTSACEGLERADVAEAVSPCDGDQLHQDLGPLAPGSRPSARRARDPDG